MDLRQTDIFCCWWNGNVDLDAPINLGLDQITRCNLPFLDRDHIKHSPEGDFTTIAQFKAEQSTLFTAVTSWSRNPMCFWMGWNTTSFGEEDHGAPYGGFITVVTAPIVTIKEECPDRTTKKPYSTSGSAGLSVSMALFPHLSTSP